MKAPAGPVRMPGKAKPKAKGTSGASKPLKSATKPKFPAKAKPGASEAEPKLLSGGNPQIAKGYGDAPVQATSAPCPAGSVTSASRLDALIVRTVPNVHKAVKWNSPLYGVEDQGWFLGIHCFTKYIKVAFFRGTSLLPVPPASPRRRKCATSTSTRTTSSTKLNLPLG